MTSDVATSDSRSGVFRRLLVGWVPTKISRFLVEFGHVGVRPRSPRERCGYKMLPRFKTTRVTEVDVEPGADARVQHWSIDP
jgi:hypothetical protein